jgi:D-sedoheptulose 7-phosphate isomerase
MDVNKVESDARELAVILQNLITGHLSNQIITLAEHLVRTIKNGNKLITFGNGGSSAESSHFAAELVSRCSKDHAPWPAISLGESSTAITAIGNDYGFENIFSRQLEAIAQKGDLVIAFSTSGASANIINALQLAKNKGCLSYLITSAKYVHNSENSWQSISIPSLKTTRIQEVHLLIIHSLSEYCEQHL